MPITQDRFLGILRSAELLLREREQIVNFINQSGNENPLGTLNTVRDLILAHSQLHVNALATVLAEIQYFKKAERRNNRAQVNRFKRKHGLNPSGVAEREADFKLMPSLLSLETAPPAAPPMAESPAPAWERTSLEKLAPELTGAARAEFFRARSKAKVGTWADSEPTVTVSTEPMPDGIAAVPVPDSEAEQAASRQAGITSEAKPDPNKPWGGKP
jgi:hypothetical protein